jgi:hypothetical protein
MRGAGDDIRCGCQFSTHCGYESAARWNAKRKGPDKPGLFLQYICAILPVVIALHACATCGSSGREAKRFCRKADRTDGIGFFILVHLNLLKRLHEAFFQLVWTNRFFSDFAQSHNGVFIAITINSQFSTTRDFTRAFCGE